MDTVLGVLVGYAVPGVAISIGLLLLLVRVSPKTRLMLLGMPFMLEVACLILAWMMHGGTIVGGMAVVVAGITTHISVSMLRRIYGYVEGGVYHRGWVSYDPKTIVDEQA